MEEATSGAGPGGRGGRAQAAEMIAAHPGALQLRLYQTLVEVSSEAASTIVFPVPMDISGGGGAAGLSQAQIQTMMQSAVALAASQQATKQLGAQSKEKLESEREESKVPAD